MQVAIKIDDNWMDKILTMSDGEVAEYLFDTIRFGTVLPKNHGRIADMDEAIKCIKDVEGEDAIWAISLIEWACSKRTLIEADKGSEDKE